MQKLRSIYSRLSTAAAEGLKLCRPPHIIQSLDHMLPPRFRTDPLLRFVRGETTELYGWPRPTIMAFVFGLMVGALIVGVISSNTSKRAFLRCLAADPRLKASHDCTTTAQVGPGT